MTPGPAFYLPAAIAFFRALRIYPAPAELIGIYQSTVSPPVFKVCPRSLLPDLSLTNIPQLVIEMTNMDVSSSSSPAARSAQLARDDSLDDISPVRGPPSEASSQEWDKVTDPGSQP